MHDDRYEALTPELLPERLGALDALTSRVGSAEGWQVEEVGDGNLNLVFIVRGQGAAVVVKQALPYVRLVGDSWPLPLTRAFFEHEALVRQAARDPGRVPEVLHFDRTQALIVMEFLSPHVILRGKLIAGERVEGVAEALGRFCARTAFYGSDLSMNAENKKADATLFLDNVALCDITEQLVFTDPYCKAERNHHTPELAPIVASLRADEAVRDAAQFMLIRFTAGPETLCHGDLHTGSIMCTDTETRVIDPEFGFYGPMGFDLGMLLANFLMAYFSQPAHRDSPDEMQDWLLSVVMETCATFENEFARLWTEERTGILFPARLGHGEAALRRLMAHIWNDAMGFCGCEMHRRCLSLAHNADFETISDTGLRARLEARNLEMGRQLLVARGQVPDASALVALAHEYNGKELL
ncbi:S-methyl-5-thioribose kinase [Thalassorhabdomicrobium marinisediminis]|uniref:S-methyl-5-thioribose kinase n=1 Tax=Thalassorhabdomicrobium marinisediminis TaxID=2170577 RepID=A0A2T7FZ75_9RHOB|nr:S-methyl-5-thioribose kinase [Thalassorhabdomicrobium marinisediminis]PVA07465.1 S-methyl-5-thioribose kinase [Thalassorhabdomicrobium marinisediminis]